MSPFCLSVEGPGLYGCWYTLTGVAMSHIIIYLTFHFCLFEGNLNLSNYL